MSDAIVLRWRQRQPLRLRITGPDQRSFIEAPASGEFRAAFIGPRGEPGPPGGSTTTKIATQALSGHRVVRVVDGGCDYASADQIDHAETILGLTTGATAQGQPAQIAVTDEVQESSWSWEEDRPVFLGLNGFLTQDLEIPGAAFIRQIGAAVAPDRILLTTRPPFIIGD